MAVADTGVGMDAAALARIFEPYFSTKATGTGLGLTIARRNVELNGGTIAVASAPGPGHHRHAAAAGGLSGARRSGPVVRPAAGWCWRRLSAAGRRARITAHSTIGDTR